MTNEELLSKAIEYSFKSTPAALTKVKNCLDAAKRKHRDPEAIRDLCKVIDEAITESGLNWDASDPNAYSDEYQKLFSKSYLNERWETLTILKMQDFAYMDKSHVNKSDQNSCHGYDACKDKEKCPARCASSHNYLNELDHLLHYLAVNVWYGTKTVSVQKVGIKIMIEDICKHSK